MISNSYDTGDTYLLLFQVLEIKI